MRTTEPISSLPAAQRIENRWRRHPLLSFAIRTAVLVLPVAATLAASIYLSRVLPRPHSLTETIRWWTIFAGGGVLTFLACSSLLGRLLPLAALFNLSLIFPDRAPSRFALVRRRVSVKDLENQLVEAIADGRDDASTRRAKAILGLVTALNVHDRRTRGHSERVRIFSDMLGEELHLGSYDRDRLTWAAMLHDIGKLRVRAEVLNKPGGPDDAERRELQRHPEEGARLIATLRPWLGKWAAAVDHHHERWDGQGYPRGLKGHAISMGGRVVAVADAFETMTAFRSYKRPMGVLAARQELVRHSGSHFDPSVVRAFLNISVGRLGRVRGLAAWIAEIPVIAPFGPGLAGIGSSGVAGVIAITAAGALALTGAVSLPLNLSRPVVPQVEAARSNAGQVPPVTDQAQTPIAPTDSPAATPAPPTLVLAPAPTTGVHPSVPQHLVVSRPAAESGSLKVVLPRYVRYATRAAPYLAIGSVSDSPGTSLSGSVNYGDGSSAQPLALGAGSFVLRHAYLTGGPFVVTVTIRDSLGRTVIVTLLASVNEGLHVGHLG
jgi:HD-GYP domain-containing protein (c-di-GMP phosphodiesterase class II)